MKYIVIVRELNEPDNNTPSEEVFCGVVEIKQGGVAKYEENLLRELGRTADDTAVIIEPLDFFTDGLMKVFEIW